MLALILIPVITRCCSAIAVLAGKPLAHSQYREEPGTKKPVAAVNGSESDGIGRYPFVSGNRNGNIWIR
jgi:hypothetical protein